MSTEDREVERGELVETSTAVAPSTDPTRQAIERAADAAISNPGVPGADEFLALAAQARILSLSGAAPKAVRNDPYVAFHLALVGRDFGISPSAAMTLVDVIEQKKGGQITYQFSLSPQLLNAQIRRTGLGSIVPAVRTRDRCVAVVLDPSGRLDHRCTGDRWPDHVDGCECHGIIGTSEFTWEDARIAGLVGGKCSPGEHVKETRGSGDRTWQACGCNQGYIAYPQRMMWWRASGFAADDWLPEAGLGMYMAEALGAAVDENGRMIDPGSVELPEGYNPDGDPAPTDQVDELRERIGALPDPAKKHLSEMWKTGDADAGRPVLRKLDDLLLDEIPHAKGLVTAVEVGAIEGRYAEPSGDESASEDDPAPETAPEPSEDDTGPEESGEPEPDGDGDEEVTLDSVAAEVKALTIGDVTRLLDDRKVDYKGWNGPTKRARLTEILLRERTTEPFDLVDETDEGAE